MIKICQRCSEEFRPPWSTARLCNDCYKESIHTTIPAEESTHSALVAEREREEEQIRLATPEQVKAHLERLMEIVSHDPDERPEPVSQIRCEHEFVGESLPMCHKCLMLEEQFWYNLFVPPQTKLSGEIQ